MHVFLSFKGLVHLGERGHLLNVSVSEWREKLHNWDSELEPEGGGRAAAQVGVLSGKV